MTQISWISESQVLNVLNLQDARRLTKEAFERVGAGMVTPMPKIAAGTPTESAHCLGSVDTSTKIAGFKTWVNSPNGAIPVISLFDIYAGTMLGVVEAMALGNLRTASVASVGTEWLMPKDSRVFLLAGTGRQAMFQLAAAAQANHFEKYLVWSRDFTKAQKLAEGARHLLGLNVVPVSDLDAAASEADVITTMTRAATPFLKVGNLKYSVHINAMGAIIPNAAELYPEVVSSASRVFVDDVGRAANDFELKTADKALTKPIWDMGGRRTEADSLTIFKSWGLGAADLMLAVAAYERNKDQPSVVIPYPKKPVFENKHLIA